MAQLKYVSEVVIFFVRKILKRMHELLIPCFLNTGLRKSISLAILAA
jgi:hypothetical protein